ncbi:Cyanate MFS transporter [[Actinomadura] parvosata subsp. kistnae]|uniref:MFS transporter n=1 Tax=[Actinomadura] parvosata subsp. kistnae TaxID=1909395 RepID=A0A1U9ZW47_9ACTN|nr:MFS transporter [Nonomuraea sp. ATCC 55076]AQZ62178.1 MFS transporter [Nonomuraea sp. ATCC 55076]SPL95936.1 Cyanate MFS transporter [Actinomadura parvosata subsp. kistnae]
MSKERSTTSKGRSGRALLVWGLLVVAANLRPSLTVVGPLLDRVQADLGLAPAVAGLLSTLPLLAFAVMSPVVPRLAARWGPERLLWWALVVLAFGIGVRWVPSAIGLFAGTVLIGAGVAVGNVLLPSLIKRDFPTRVGLLTSAYATVMGAVAAVASGVAVPISQAAAGGWSTAFGCWIVLALAAVVLWLPQVRAPRPAAETIRRHRLPWRSALAWAVTAFMGLQSLGFYVAVTWLPQVFQDSGVSAATAGWLLFLFQAVAVLTSLAAPAALRRAGDQRTVATLSSAVVLGGYLGLLVAPGWAWLWSIVLGLGGGACLVLALAFLSLRAQDATVAGTLSAMAQSVGYLVAAAGPVIFGLLHTVSSGWHAPLVLMCVAAAGQVIFAMAASRGTVAPTDDQTLEPAPSPGRS